MKKIKPASFVFFSCSATALASASSLSFLSAWLPANFCLKNSTSSSFCIRNNPRLLKKKKDHTWYLNIKCTVETRILFSLKYHYHWIKWSNLDCITKLTQMVLKYYLFHIMRSLNILVSILMYELANFSHFGPYHHNKLTDILPSLTWVNSLKGIFFYPKKKKMPWQKLRECVYY